MPSTPLLLRSPPWLRIFPPPPPAVSAVKGLPRVWKPFLLHGSLPLVQVLSLFFCLCCFLFLLPYPGAWGVSCLLGGLTSSASVQWVFYRSSSTCRCISDVFVGRKVVSASYSSAILKLLPRQYVIHICTSTCSLLTKTLYCGLNCVLPKKYVDVLTLVPQNVTSFGNRVFTKVNKLK